MTSPWGSLSSSFFPIGATMAKASDLFTVSGAADFRRCSPRTVDRHIKTGKLDAEELIGPGGKRIGWVVRRDALIRWVVPKAGRPKEK